MSQGLRSCSKTTNFETINCESYLCSLSKVEPHRQRCPQKCSCPRQRSLSNSSSKPHIGVPSSNMKLLPGTVKQCNLPATKTRSSSNMLHKDVIHDNSALVEVTVKTQTKPRSHKNFPEGKNNHRLPWSDLLKSSRNREVASTFGSFDPLRTLHFLGKELNSALKSNTFSDYNVSKIVTEMMDALNRLPPDVSFSIQNFPNNMEPIKNSDRIEIPEKLSNMYRPRFEHKVCQTVMDNTLLMKTETLQKHLEESIKDLDVKCKEMEDFCKSLKRDKHQLERQLVSEKETVRYLQNQLDDLQKEKVTSGSSRLTQLTKENNLLTTQVKSLQYQLDIQVLSMDELKCQAKEIEKQKEKLEVDNVTLHHNLSIAELEKQKHLAIIAVRDHQMKEVLTEMNQLQEVVNDELLELQKNPSLTEPSSQSAILDTWKQIQGVAKLKNGTDVGDTAKVLFPTNGLFVNQRLLSNCSSSLFDLPSYTSSNTNDSKSTNVQDYDG